MPIRTSSGTVMTRADHYKRAEQAWLGWLAKVPAYQDGSYGDLDDEAVGPSVGHLIQELLVVVDVADHEPARVLAAVVQGYAVSTRPDMDTWPDVYVAMVTSLISYLLQDAEENGVGAMSVLSDALTHFAAVQPFVGQNAPARPEQSPDCAPF